MLFSNTIWQKKFGFNTVAEKKAEENPNYPNQVNYLGSLNRIEEAVKQEQQKNNL